MEYRTCTYIHDDGGICASAAVTDHRLVAQVSTLKSTGCPGFALLLG